MTSKTSLFNAGIYKNILKRFKWGSFIYLVLLFFSTVFPILMQRPEFLAERYSNYYGSYGNYRDILLGQYTGFPYFLSFVVPTVVAVLIFGHVHAVKQGIFTHALPVSRKENYVSSLLGGVSLMLAPIVICALILIIMSLSGYSKVLPIDSILMWVAIQLSVIFIMFAFASISGVLTGHGVAHVAVNAILHLFPMLVALMLALISEVFLYGFVNSGSFIGEEILRYTPISWLAVDILDEDSFKAVAFWCYIILALVLYLLGYLLYSKRKIELCGEVAAFKIFRPILKYTVTAAAVLCTFGIFWESSINAIAVFVVTALFGAIAYFACEMIMSKSVKVFGRFKGYLVFAVCTAAVFLFCAFTSIFGYETRIPRMDDIAGATVVEGYQENADRLMLTDSENIEAVRTIHSELISDIPLTDRTAAFNSNGGALSVKYKLKNGRMLERRYPVSIEEHDRIMTKMYEIPEYKYCIKGIDVLNVENVTYAHLDADAPNYHYGGVVLTGDAPELMQAIKDDIAQLSYSELERTNDALLFRVSITVNRDDNVITKVFDDVVFPPATENKYASVSRDTHELNITVNSSFTNTIAFMNRQGYYAPIIENFVNDLYICRLPIEKNGDTYTFKGDSGFKYNFRVSLADCIGINAEHTQRLAEDVSVFRRNADTEGKNYVVFSISDAEHENFVKYNDNSCPMNVAMFFNDQTLPDFLRGYVE